MKNRLLNFLKGIGCIGIILMHVVVPGKIGVIIKTIAGYAVPLFFMISGYYAYGIDSDIVHSKIKRRLKRILRILLYSILLYFTFTFSYLYITEGLMGIKLWFSTDFTIKNLIQFIFLNNLDLIWAWHLWFLIALMYDYILLMFFNRLNSQFNFYILIPICFAIRIFTCGGNPLWVNNFFVTGLPFVLLGNLIAKYKNKFAKLKNLEYIILAFIGMIFSIITLKLHTYIEVSYIGIILLATSLFLLATFNPRVKVNRIIEVIGEKYSLHIYIIHLMFVILMDKMYIRLGVNKNILLLYIKPMIVIVISLAFALIWNQLEKLIFTALHALKKYWIIKKNLRNKKV